MQLLFQLYEFFPENVDFDLASLDIVVSVPDSIYNPLGNGPCGKGKIVRMSGCRLFEAVHVKL